MSRSPLIALVGLVLVACSSGSQPTSSAPAPTAPPGTPTATTSASATPAPSPTADLAHPVGVIAMGHSGLTGEGTGNHGKDGSWATGTLPAVNSIYLRLVAVIPETEGQVANRAEGGASSNRLIDQTRRAIDAVPAPLLAIINTVDNDLECDASTVIRVGQDVELALQAIREASPNTKILIVGQAGRPSADYLQELAAQHPEAVEYPSGIDDDPCGFFDLEGNPKISGIERLAAVIDEYEAEIARVCAAFPNCVTDGGVRRAYVDTFDNFSPDLNHFNIQGEAAQAELLWPVVESLLGL